MTEKSLLDRSVTIPAAGKSLCPPTLDLPAPRLKPLFFLEFMIRLVQNGSSINYKQEFLRIALRYSKAKRIVVRFTLDSS